MCALILVGGGACNDPPPAHTLKLKPPNTLLNEQLARPFAATGEKALVWRESSAQHHLSEGGEFPVTEFPESECVSLCMCGDATCVNGCVRRCVCVWRALGTRPHDGAWTGVPPPKTTLFTQNTPTTHTIPGLGVSKVQALHDGPLCHPLKFGARVAPQWRDKLVLQLADDLGYHVKFLGEHGRVEEEGEREGSAMGRWRHGRRGEGVTEVKEGKGEGAGLSLGPPPRRRGLGDEAAAAVVMGVDGSLVVGEEEGPRQQQHGEQQQEGRRPVLYWMPFFRITALRPDLHPYNPWRGRYDCTHYCYTPLLWDPLVDSLHAAVADA